MKMGEIAVLGIAAGAVFLLLKKFGGGATLTKTATASDALARERNIAYAEDWFAGRV